jgi:hypothetical protein
VLHPSGIRADKGESVAEFFDAIDDAHEAFMARQHVFFVATTAPGTRINLSPKGLDCFRVLDARTVAWLDLGGSGNETNAHLLADGRITVMFCAFDQPALILRLYGRARPVLPQDDGWRNLYARFEPLAGTRQIFVMAVDQVQTSCGYAVPQMALVRERQTLTKLHARSTPEQMLAHWAGSDATSIDGLPVRWPSALP